MDPVKVSIGIWKNPKESVRVKPAADTVSCRAITLTSISFCSLFLRKDVICPCKVNLVSGK